MAAREETQRMFESKLDAMRQASDGSQAQLSAIRSELHNSLKQADSLRAQVTRLEAEVVLLLILILYMYNANTSI